jgi:hypothetical protein
MAELSLNPALSGPLLCSGGAFRTWAWLQSLLAFGLLLNIVIVSVLSAPLPFRVFMNEPANTFVTYFPYVEVRRAFQSPRLRFLYSMSEQVWMC